MITLVVDGAPAMRSDQYTALLATHGAPLRPNPLAPAATAAAAAALP